MHIKTHAKVRGIPTAWINVEAGDTDQGAR